MSNKPSYGVFLVDIFASSVGIFILVSLLYTLASAQTTSHETMVERFKTLVKRDKVPVHRYFVPHQKEPLHDWGVRAAYAREQKEALILLLRDKVLLYHTNEVLSISQIIDSGKIRQYYQKYNRQGRLFLEIHYNDAYHALNAKIRQALPQNVRLWSHWAYNAGNIRNPNPTAQELLRMRLGGNNSNNDGSNNGEGGSTQGSGQQSGGYGVGSEGDEQSGDGTGQSGDGSGESGDGTGQSADGTGQPGDGTGQSADGDQLGEGQGEDEGSVAEFIAEQQQSNSDQFNPNDQGFAPGTDQAIDDQPFDTQLDGESAEQADVGSTQSSDGVWPRKSADPKAINNRSPNPDDVQAQVSELLNQSRNDDKFVEHFLTDNSPTTDLTTDNIADEQIELATEQAKTYIQKNAFLAIPLYSPIHHFMLDVRIPGYAFESYYMDAVRFKLLKDPNHSASSTTLTIARGDYIVPVDTPTNRGKPANEPRWVQVKINTVQQADQPKTGWLYGLMQGEVFMMQVYHNAIQSPLKNDGKYWFKQPQHNDKSQKLLDHSTPPATVEGQ
ncbi:MAG: hypothetical protein ACI9FJ_001152 [Alteromonadaceae bacterium]